jgi:hypothetical protein
MKWNNLRLNKCPKCSKDLSDKLVGNFFHCPCGFMISVRRFKEIVSNKTGGKIEEHYRPPDENPE